MIKDEINALQLLSKFKNVLETATTKIWGEIIKYYTEGCLFVFKRVNDGMNCAISVQLVSSTGFSCRG